MKCLNIYEDFLEVELVAAWGARVAWVISFLCLSLCWAISSRRKKKNLRKREKHTRVSEVNSDAYFERFVSVVPPCGSICILIASLYSRKRKEAILQLITSQEFCTCPSGWCLQTWHLHGKDYCSPVPDIVKQSAVLLLSMLPTGNPVLEVLVGWHLISCSSVTHVVLKVRFFHLSWIWNTSFLHSRKMSHALDMRAIKIKLMLILKLLFSMWVTYCNAHVLTLKLKCSACSDETHLSVSIVLSAAPCVFPLLVYLR